MPSKASGYYMTAWKTVTVDQLRNDSGYDYCVSKLKNNMHIATFWEAHIFSDIAVTANTLILDAAS